MGPRHRRKPPSKCRSATPPRPRPLDQAQAQEAHRKQRPQHCDQLSPTNTIDYSTSAIPTLEGMLMTQYSMNKGLEVFGDMGMEAVVKEL